MIQMTNFFNSSDLETLKTPGTYTVVIDNQNNFKIMEGDDEAVFYQQAFATVTHMKGYIRYYQGNYDDTDMTALLKKKVMEFVLSLYEKKN